MEGKNYHLLDRNSFLTSTFNDIGINFHQFLQQIKGVNHFIFATLVCNSKIRRILHMINVRVFFVDTDSNTTSLVAPQVHKSQC